MTFASLKESSGLRRAASLACLHLLGFVISWLCDAEHGGFESSFTGAQRPERTARFCLQCRAEAAGGSQRCLSSGLSGSSRRSGEMRESEQSRKDRQQKRKKKGKKMEKEKKKEEMLQSAWKRAQGFGGELHCRDLLHSAGSGNCISREGSR